MSNQRRNAYNTAGFLPRNNRSSQIRERRNYYNDRNRRRNYSRSPPYRRPCQRGNSRDREYFDRRNHENSHDEQINVMPMDANLRRSSTASTILQKPTNPGNNSIKVEIDRYRELDRDVVDLSDTENEPSSSTVTNLITNDAVDMNQPSTSSGIRCNFTSNNLQNDSTYKSISGNQKNLVENLNSLLENFDDNQRTSLIKKYLGDLDVEKQSPQIPPNIYTQLNQRSITFDDSHRNLQIQLSSAIGAATLLRTFLPMNEQPLLLMVEMCTDMISLLMDSYYKLSDIRKQNILLKVKPFDHEEVNTLFMKTNTESINSVSNPSISNELPMNLEVRQERNFCQIDEQILNYLSIKYGNNSALSLGELGIKVANLLKLETPLTPKQLVKIQIGDIDFPNGNLEIKLPGRESLMIFEMKHKPAICTVSAVRTYINITAKYRQFNNNNLLIGSKQPHGPLRDTTVMQWITKTREDSTEAALRNN